MMANLQSVVPKRQTLYPNDISVEILGNQHTDQNGLLIHNISTTQYGNGNVSGVGHINDNDVSLVIEKNGGSHRKNVGSGSISKNQNAIFSQNIRVPAMVA